MWIIGWVSISYSTSGWNVEGKEREKVRIYNFIFTSLTSAIETVF